MTIPPPRFDPALADLPAALSGEFTLERELGRGGMGVVYLARDLRLDRQVALKVLPPDVATSEVRARFLREARTAGQLSHPHIVHIHRADERGEFAFFVMGLVDGENLGQRVRDRGPLPPVEVVRHLREVAWALAYAHARGVIHRDVKPENIMIERGTNRALVTDFGIARSERSPSVTGAEHVVGTAHYMSPEQVQGAALDGRSDLYALGIVGFFLLSGRLPFDGEGAAAVLVAHVTRPAPPLLSVAPQVPRALAEVIDRCLSKDPAARYATGEDLSEALRRAMEGAVAAREPVVNGGHRVLSEEQATLVWRRAAQLQAEAAARLERETRASATRVLGPGTPADPDATGSADASAPGTSTYRLQDVESAAVEAGISQRFVGLALSELPGDTAAPLPLDATSLRGWLAQRLFGDLRPALSVSRIIRAPARDVLKLIGRTFQGAPYRMTLRDQIGPHPLDGGIIVFKLPDLDASGGTGYPFMWLRYNFYMRELRVTLRLLEHERGATEVSAFADLRPGHGVNVWGYGILSGGTTVGAGAVGAVIGVKAMALAGALLVAPIAITGLAVGALALAASRASYRQSLKKATIELEELLAAIDVSLRSRSIFDEDPPVLTPPTPSAGSDGAIF